MSIFGHFLYFLIINKEFKKIYIVKFIFCNAENITLNIKLLNNIMEKEIEENFIGVIIEESLEDKNILKNVKILKTKVEQVTEKHKTPWVKQWTLHTVEIPREEAKTIAKELSIVLDSKHNWYADFKNKTNHYIIFKNKIFYIDRTSKEQYDEAKLYGISLGIPEYQVDFHPEVKEWERDEKIENQTEEKNEKKEKSEVKSLGRYNAKGFKEITMEKPIEIDATGIKRPWRLDQKGYFLIKVNRELNKIEAAFCDLKENKVRIIIRGDNPVEVYTAILKENLVSMLDHAADLGVELEKAYIALKTGKKYTQDKIELEDEK